MGLDITFYQSTERIPAHATSWVDDAGDAHECEHNVVMLWSASGQFSSDTFAFTQRGLDSEYHFESTGETAWWHMSYGTYSLWRACLLHLVRPDLVLPEGEQAKNGGRSYYPAVYEMDDQEFQQIPFAELIDFADNEGTYGPEVAAELLKDFREYADRAESEFGTIFPTWTDYFREKYREYMDCLSIVGPTGLVDYH
jgi:hypothetical protein